MSGVNLKQTLHFNFNLITCTRS